VTDKKESDLDRLPDMECPGDVCMGMGPRVKAWLFGEPFVIYCGKCNTVWERAGEGWRMRSDW
jgi:hypothetical protein